MKRKIAVAAHASRVDLEHPVREFQQSMRNCGFEVIDAAGQADLADCEMVVVFGGDGTILWAAERAREHNVPILGINYGHVGFLAEVDDDAMSSVVEAIATSTWTVDRRMTIDVEVTSPDGRVMHGWALNEVSVEKSPPARMIEVDLAVDGRDVSSFKTDGVLISTPTGSTGYNFSAGGPIVWPNVDAILLVPIAAHALFTRPLVVAPKSQLEVRVRADDALVNCDGRRTLAAPQGSVITASQGHRPVKLVRLDDAPFSERLVAKFKLPVEGWRNERTPSGDSRGDQ